MQILQNIEDLYFLPKYVKKCSIKRDIILKYLLYKKETSTCSLNKQILHDILIKQTKNIYYLGTIEQIDDDIIIKRKDIDKMLIV